MRRNRAALMALGAALAMGACARGPEPPRPARLAVLYASCTVNKAYLAPYDEEVTFTPNLRRFGEESIVARRYRTEAGLSGVAYASMLTGRGGVETGVLTHPLRLPDSELLLTEAFAEAGWEVLFWDGHPLRVARLGYAQGVAPENLLSDDVPGGRSRIGEVLERLGSDETQKALLVFTGTYTHEYHEGSHVRSFCAAHAEQCPVPADEMAQYLRLYSRHRYGLQYGFDRTVETLGVEAREIPTLESAVETAYRASVWELDRQFGRLMVDLSTAGLLDEAIVVFTADHGETLVAEKAPYRWSHAYAVRAEVLDPPLMIRLPSAHHTGAYDAVLRSIDLLPTLAGLAGVELPEQAGIQGVDASASLLGREPPPPLVAFSHGGVPTTAFQKVAPDRLASLRTLRPSLDASSLWVAARSRDTVWKLKGGESAEAYDLATDPGEARDVFDPASEEHRRMEATLRRYRTALESSWASKRDELEPGAWGERLDQAWERTLRSLGYIQ